MQSETGGSNDQKAVLAYLGNPSSYDPAPDTIRRIDTHGAVVFLAGDLAYKIKRAVKLRYLDFSTLDKRRAVCERELEINRKTAPDIYLGVVPITRSEQGSLAIDGDGPVVEWAVKMRRFDQADMFDALALRGALPLELMPALAQRIANAHASASKRRSFDVLRVMKRVVASIASSLEEAVPDLPEEEVTAFSKGLRAQLQELAPLLGARARRGFVRRCHGDLHLRNIVMVDGVPTLFDAIEFDEELATIDILYDLAFLLMDLWHRDLKAHANLLFNAYMRLPEAGPPLTGLGGLALLPFFMAVRAGVRAMVARDRLGVVEGAARHAAIIETRSFFDLARTLAKAHPPRLIAVGGLSGTGKSTLAAAIAPAVGSAPGALVVRSDVERKRLAGVGETERLGPEQYSAAATGRVYAALCAKAHAALKAGHSVILDAVFARAVQRDRVVALARRAEVPFEGLWLEAPEGELIGRVDARRGDASDADAGVVRKQLDYDVGEMTWERVDASGTPECVSRRAQKILDL